MKNFFELTDLIHDIREEITGGTPLNPITEERISSFLTKEAHTYSRMFQLVVQHHLMPMKVKEEELNEAITDAFAVIATHSASPDDESPAPS